MVIKFKLFQNPSVIQEYGSVNLLYHFFVFELVICCVHVFLIHFVCYFKFYNKLKSRRFDFF